MDAAAKARVEARRKTWSGGKVKLSEAEIVDEQFWLSMTPEERFLTVWSLSLEGYGTLDAATAGLRGSSSGIRRG
jgi:hypothetical protein